MAFVAYRTPFRAALFAFALSACATAALAQQSGTAAAPAGSGKAAVSGATLGTTQNKVSVSGFRSAEFGMDEKAVRAAIAADFDVKDSAIESGENPAERTKILSVKVPGVLEDGGAAIVSYSFGYKSHKLTQVSVLWSPETDSAINPDKLVANGNVLQTYFMSNGYEPDSVIVNAAVPEGILLFRGSDAEGRMTVLLLRGPIAPPSGDGKRKQSVLTPQNLLLAYISDPKNPDVFKVESGKF